MLNFFDPFQYLRYFIQFYIEKFINKNVTKLGNKRNPLIIDRVWKRPKTGAGPIHFFTFHFGPLSLDKRNLHILPYSNFLFLC